MAMLTAGAVQRLVSGTPGEAISSVVQILAIKRVQPQSQTANAPVDRYRLALSDGINYVPAMIAVQLNHLIAESQLVVNSVIRLNNYTCNVVQGRRIVIVSQLDIVCRDMAKVGAPVNVDQNVGPAATNQGTGSGMPQQQHYGQVPQQTAMQYQQNKGANHQEYGHGGAAQVPQAQQGSSYQRSTGPARGGNPMGDYGGQRGHGSGLGAHYSDQNPAWGDQSSPQKAITPVARLNPYQNRWMIKARVTNKSPIKQWSNARGEGQLISIDLVDESGEIRATGFHELADRIDKTVEIGKVYYISGGQIKNANRQWTNLNNPYELSLDRNATIELCFDNVESVPGITYSFVQIANLEQHAKDSFVDVVAIVKSAPPITVITTRATGKQLPKRDLVLVDDSQTEVTLTLWGAHAESYNEEGCPVIVVKGAKVGDFRGRTLSASATSVVQYNADLAEAHRLRGWYDSVGHSTEVVSISNVVGGGGGQWNDERLFIEQAKSRVMAMADRPLYFMTSGFIALVKKDNAFYKACPMEDCNKKLVETTSAYMCEKCGAERQTFKIRLMLQMSVVDPLGQAWVTAFHEQAEQILGMTGQELYDIHMANKDMYDMRFQEQSFTQGMFRIRVKMETFQDEQRPRFHLQGFKPQDYASEAAFLLGDIARLQAL